MKYDLEIYALRTAIALRLPLNGCIVHSDGGGQYYSYDHQKILQEHGLEMSKSGKSNCYKNNAVLRPKTSLPQCLLILINFFKTIKAELI